MLCSIENTKFLYQDELLMGAFLRNVCTQYISNVDGIKYGGVVYYVYTQTLI